MQTPTDKTCLAVKVNLYLYRSDSHSSSASKLQITDAVELKQIVTFPKLSGICLTTDPRSVLGIFEVQLYELLMHSRYITYSRW